MKNYIDSIYAENMWINERQYELLLRRVEEDSLDKEAIDTIVKNAADSAKSNYKKIFKRMGNKRYYYKLDKCIYEVGREENVIFKCKYKFQHLAGNFKIVISPVYNYEYHADGSYKPWTKVISAEDNQLVIPYTFNHEDMYIVTIFYVLDEEEMLLYSSNVYALEKDLFNLNFYKADLHMHTTYSDGYEPPELVATAARKKGMDIIAVTDHNNFEGSVVAKERARELGLNMTVILGEEFSLEYSPMHILALGTDVAVDTKYKTKQILALKETQSIKEQIGNIEVDVDAYAGTQVLLDEVNRLGGVSVLAHPYWKPIALDGYRMDTPEKLYGELAKNKRFDGIELVSGSTLEEGHVSNLQTALARDILNGFKDVPLIGITDSHYYSTDPICGRHYTIILSKTREGKDILSALKEGKCVAVEISGKNIMCYGDFRYVKLAQFLVDNYFPERDEFAYIEAKKVEERILNK